MACTSLLQPVPDVVDEVALSVVLYTLGSPAAVLLAGVGGVGASQVSDQGPEGDGVGGGGVTGHRRPARGDRR